MGAGSFMSGLYSMIGPKLEELHAREDALRGPKAQMYINILQNPQTPDPAYGEAWDQLNKIYGKNKEAKAILGRLKQFTDQTRQPGSGAASGTPVESAGQQALPRPNTGGWRTASPQEIQQFQATQAAGPGMQLPSPQAGQQPQPAPQPASQQPAMPARHQGALSKIGHYLGSTGKNIAENTFGFGIDRRLAQARQAQDIAQMGAGLTEPTEQQQRFQKYQQFSNQIGRLLNNKEIDSKTASRLLDEGRSSILLGFKPAAASQKPQLVTLQMTDSSTQPAFQVGEEFYSTSGDLIPGSNIQGIAPKASSAAARPGTKITSIDDAITFQEQGIEQFIGENGKPLPLKQMKAIDPNLQIQPIFIGQNVRWQPFSPEWKTNTVGNLVYQRLPTQPPSQATPIGVARTSTVTTLPAMQFNQQTKQFERVPGTRQPESPGLFPAVAAPAKPPTAMPPTPNLQGGRLAPPQPSLAPQPLGGIPAGQYNAIQQRATPVRLAWTQIFKQDPQNPSFQPLINFADLADDKGAQKRIGLAVRLARSALLQAEQAGGEVSTHIGPISASTGGLITWASNAMGIPVKITKAQNQQMHDAIEDMRNHNPREVQVFNQMMSTYGTVAGVRRLTGGSAAQATVSNLEAEVPLIGFNVFSREDFAQKMASIAEEISNGAEGLPKGVLGDYNPSAIQQKIEGIYQGKSGKGKSPAGSSFNPDDYIDKILKGK